MNFKINKSMLFLLMLCSIGHASEKKDVKEKEIKAKDSEKEKTVKTKVSVVLPDEVLSLIFTPGTDALRKILDEHPEYINAKTKDDITLISLLIQWSRQPQFKLNVFENIAHLLISRGANIEEALDLELFFGPGRMLEYLLNENLIKKKGLDGYELLYRAINAANVNAVAYLLARSDVDVNIPASVDLAKERKDSRGKYYTSEYANIIQLLERYRKPTYHKELGSKTKEALESEAIGLPENLSTIAEEYITGTDKPRPQLSNEQRRMKYMLEEALEKIEATLKKMPKDLAELPKDRQDAINRLRNRLFVLNEQLKNIEQESNLFSLNFLQKHIKENNIKIVIAITEDNPDLLLAKDQAGNTALDIARAWNRKEIAAWLENMNIKYQKQLHQELVQKVAKKQKSPIYLIFKAIHENNQDIIIDYIRKGGNLNMVDKNRISPLMYAASKGDPFLVIMLVNNKADIYAHNRWGATALHYAANLGHADVVEELLHRAPDLIYFQNYREETAYDNAQKSKNEIQKKMQQAQKQAIEKKFSGKEMAPAIQRYQDRLFAYERTLGILESYMKKQNKKEKQ